MPKFDGSPYTQLTTLARGDIHGLVKDVSETDPALQTKFVSDEDLHKFGAWASKVRSVTASGTVTLANTDPMFIEIDPNGSDRDVSFPSKGDDNHGYYVLHSGSANTLTLKRSGGTAITTLITGEAKYIMPSTLEDFNALAGGGGGTEYAGEEGSMKNGKISVTVASNNLTLALKTMAGTDPSAGDPVKIVIGGAERTITAALSVTVNAGANSFNAGSAELATKAVDYFPQFSWRAASSAVVIGISRIPYATLYSDFSATATNEKYGVFSTTPASSDAVVCWGRFGATLSAGAGYTWTVPTYTTANLIQRRIEHTRWLSWVPTLVKLSGYTNAIYRIRDKEISYIFDAVTKTISAGSGVVTFTLPFAPPTPDLITFGFGYTGAAYGGLMLQYQNATPKMFVYKDLASSNWAGGEINVIIDWQGTREL